MRAMLRKALLFAAAFLPLFALFLVLYPRVMPLYEPLPVAAANLVMAALPTPTSVEASAAGGWASFTYRDGLRQRFYTWEPFVKHLVYGNLALLPALLLATPVAWRRRLELAAIGVAGLVVVHALTLVTLIRGYLCLQSSPGNFFCLAMLRGSYASGQIFAAVLWAALTWRFWLPRRRGAARASSSRGQPSDRAHG